MMCSAAFQNRHHATAWTLQLMVDSLSQSARLAVCRALVDREIWCALCWNVNCSTQAMRQRPHHANAQSPRRMALAKPASLLNKSDGVIRLTQQWICSASSVEGHDQHETFAAAGRAKRG